MVKAKESVFLNVPCDRQFTRLYLAYITALSAMGFVQEATLGITGNRRLDRIAGLIERCEYSIHDLSRVQLDLNPPRTPRFNMPFEFGLAVAWAHEHPKHQWFVFESRRRRLNKSLSDLDGTDAYIHDGTVRGVMREVCNAFVSPGSQPTVPEMIEDVSRVAEKYPGSDEEDRRAFEVYGASVLGSVPGSGCAAQEVSGT
jgi:hypothetical protein